MVKLPTDRLKKRLKGGQAFPFGGEDQDEHPNGDEFGLGFVDDERNRIPQSALDLPVRPQLSENGPEEDGKTSSTTEYGVRTTQGAVEIQGVASNCTSSKQVSSCSSHIRQTLKRMFNKKLVLLLYFMQRDKSSRWVTVSSRSLLGSSPLSRRDRRTGARSSFSPGKSPRNLKWYGIGVGKLLLRLALHRMLVRPGNDYPVCPNCKKKCRVSQGCSFVLAEFLDEDPKEIELEHLQTED